MTAYKGLVIVPFKFIGSLNKGSKLFWKENMPNYIAIPAELDLWEQYWKNSMGIDTKVLKTVNHLQHISKFTRLISKLGTLLRPRAIFPGKEWTKQLLLY